MVEFYTTLVWVDEIIVDLIPAGADFACLLCEILSMKFTCGITLIDFWFPYSRKMSNSDRTFLLFLSLVNIRPYYPSSSIIPIRHSTQIKIKFWLAWFNLHPFSGLIIVIMWITKYISVFIRNVLSIFKFVKTKRQDQRAFVKLFSP